MRDAGYVMRDVGIIYWHGNCNFILKQKWSLQMSYRKFEIWKIAREVSIDIHK